MPTQAPPRVRELRTALETKTKLLDGLSSGWKIEDGGGIVMSQAEHDTFVQTVRQAEEIKGLIDLEEVAAGLREYANAPVGTPTAQSDAAQAHASNGEFAIKSLGDYFLESKEFQDAKAGGFRGGKFKMSVDQSMPQMKSAATAMESKEIFNLSAGSVTHQTLGGIQSLGIAEQRRRQTHVRDLFPKATTSAAVLYGVRETGWINRAAQVPQRQAADGGPATGGPTDTWGRKPTSQLLLTPVMYPVATIAHLLPAHETILKDEPRLRTFINVRMVDGVMYAEDETLLFGEPGGEQITGIFNTPGVQTYTGLNTDQWSGQLRRAATRVMLAEYDPTGVVLHPLDWENLELETDDNGQYRIALSVAIGAEKRLWKLDVVATTAMHQGQYGLGAFGLAAQYYDREAVSVVVSTEHAENFADNVVTFRAEERGALEVPRPEAFVLGQWTTPA